MQVAAVIPAYNEEDTITAVVAGTAEHVDEVVVVDDGSTDRTAELARRGGATVIEHAINTGVGGAQRTGYRYVLRNGFDFLVQIDGDGQHSPEYIPTLLEAARDNDMVIGSRYLNTSYENYPVLRRAGIKFFTTTVNALSGLKITDVTSGFRVYRVESLADIIYESDGHWAVEQTLEAAKQGLRIQEVSVEMPVREAGQSQFDPVTTALYPLRMADVIIRVILFR